MQVRLPEVICDTSFLMHLADGRIRNLDDPDVVFLEFVVPDVTLRELERLAAHPFKGRLASRALAMAGTMKRLHMPGDYADTSILERVRARGGTVATVDRRLKRMVKSAGGHVVSIHDDTILAE